MSFSGSLLQLSGRTKLVLQSAAFALFRLIWWYGNWARCTLVVNWNEQWTRGWISSVDCYFSHIHSNHKGLIKNVLMNWILTTATWALELKKLSKISTVQFVVCAIIQSLDPACIQALSWERKGRSPGNRRWTLWQSLRQKQLSLDPWLLPLLLLGRLWQRALPSKRILQVQVFLYFVVDYLDCINTFMCVWLLNCVFYACLLI